MCKLVGTGLQALGSEIRVVMCQVGLWYKNPTQFMHSLFSKDWGFKRNNRNPSSPLALAQQNAVGSLEMSEL